MGDCRKKNDVQRKSNGNKRDDKKSSRNEKIKPTVKKPVWKWRAEREKIEWKIECWRNFNEKIETNIGIMKKKKRYRKITKRKYEESVGERGMQ